MVLGATGGPACPMVHMGKLLNWGDTPTHTLATPPASTVSIRRFLKLSAPLAVSFLCKFKANSMLIRVALLREAIGDVQKQNHHVAANEEVDDA